MVNSDCAIRSRITVEVADWAFDSTSLFRGCGFILNWLRAADYVHPSGRLEEPALTLYIIKEGWCSTPVTI